MNYNVTTTITNGVDEFLAIQDFGEDNIQEVYGDISELDVDVYVTLKSGLCIEYSDDVFRMDNKFLNIIKDDSFKLDLKKSIFKQLLDLYLTKYKNIGYAAHSEIN